MYQTLQIPYSSTKKPTIDLGQSVKNADLLIYVIPKTANFNKKVVSQEKDFDSSYKDKNVKKVFGENQKELKRVLDLVSERERKGK